MKLLKHAARALWLPSMFSMFIAMVAVASLGVAGLAVVILSGLAAVGYAIAVVEGWFK